MTAVCYHCGDRHAVCYGAYEGAEIAAAACDICCGHGNEDGWCIQIADMLEREPLVQEVIAKSRAFEALRARRARLLDQSDAAGDLDAACKALAEWKP